MASACPIIRHHLSALLFVLGIAAGCATAPAVAQPVVINEIMTNPLRVFEHEGEWFELYNPGTSDVDIDGWTITDNSGESHMIDNGGPLRVPAGGFLVLGNNGDPALNGGANVGYVYSGLDFIRDNDALILFDQSGVEVDRVEWSFTLGFPTSGRGNSMELIDPSLDNNVGEHWCFATMPFGIGDLGTPGSENDCEPLPPTFGSCGDPATLISAVQGSGTSSPLEGTAGVIVEGVVVGDFQAANRLRGFFLQEEDTDNDADPQTSEGIFVFDNGFGDDVVVGDVVRVEGTATEFFGLTEINNVTNLAVCAAGATVTPATVILPVNAVSDFEHREGMLVDVQGPLYVTGNFNQGRFGEVDLSVGGPLDVPTNVVAPGPEALALEDLNDRSRIQLDDGSSMQNPGPLPPYVGDGNTLRTGDTVDSVTAVLGYSFGAYELHPVAPVNFTRVNARTASPDVGGTVRVASFNTLNYFTTLDVPGALCGPSAVDDCRGADNAIEFMRQRDKLVAAITGVDADVIGLIEIENEPGDVAIMDLVNGLNDATAPGTYDYIQTGAVGSDVIRVGLVYRPAAVTPLNAFAVLDTSVDPTFDDARNRPALAQSFTANATGVVFTVAVNHLKSKGADCNDVGDMDAGDGQGECNGVRTAAAAALTNWLAADPTASGAENYLIVGDLNAYAQEDPVAVIEMDGYADLIETFAGRGIANGAYSFNFGGESGYLDHALSSSALSAYVTGAAVWHINADEPAALDYNDFNQAALYNADEFRSSDHDPVVVGLFGDLDGDGVTDADDAHPDSNLDPSVVVDGCDTGVGNDVLPSGSSIADLVTDAFNAGGAAAVEALVASLQDDGVIDANEAAAILACVGIDVDDGGGGKDPSTGDSDDDSDSDSDRHTQSRSDDDSDSDSDSDSDRRKKKRRRSDDDSDSDSDDDSDRHKKKKKKRGHSDDDSDSDSDDDSDRRSKKKKKKKRSRSDDDSDDDSDRHKKNKRRRSDDDSDSD